MKVLFVILTVVAFAHTACAAEPLQVPYRLTATNHVLVRVKINGKGPFNFILDTGAPTLFIATKAAAKAGIVPPKTGLSKLERLEFEGGLVIEDAEGKIDNLFQLEGMNGLGLAGTELHGVVGYNVLARYRIEYDFTRDKLSWMPLDFTPPRLQSLGGRRAPAGLEMLGSLMKFMGGTLGMKAETAATPRGFLGAEVADDGGGIVVRRILPRGPAANAGWAVGDRIGRVGSAEVSSSREFAKKIATLGAGERLEITILRSGRSLELPVELGKGL